MAQTLSGTGIAHYLSRADGDASNASTWAVVDPLSFQDLISSNGIGTFFDESSLSTSSQTTYKKSVIPWTYTSSPPTIDGIALKLNSHTGVGTLTVALDIANVDVAGTVVTCNLTDLPATGWFFLKFAAPVTLLTSTYTVKFKTSVNGTVTLRCSGGSVFPQLLRTTTTGVPQATLTQRDNLYIMGEITGAGAISNRVVTWDITANNFPYNSITVSSYATVNLENAPSNDYYMHSQCDIRIYAGGIMNIGTIGTPVDVTSTFTVTLHPTTTSTLTSFVVITGGTLNCYGSPKTVKTHLTANASAAATSITVDDATGWEIGDQIALAGTGTVYSDCEQVVITSVSGTTIGIAPLAHAHLGTIPRQAEVINLTRNIRFVGFSSTSKASFANMNGNLLGQTPFSGSTVLRYVEFGTFMGLTGADTSATLYLNSYTNGIDIQYCSIHHGASSVIGVYIDVLSGPITFANNVIFDYRDNHLLTNLSEAFTGTLAVDSNVFMYNPTSTNMIVWGLSEPATFTNNYLIGEWGSITGCFLEIKAQGLVGTMTGNTIHCSSAYGINVTTVQVTNYFQWNSATWIIYDVTNLLEFSTILVPAIVSINGMTAFNFTNGIWFKKHFVGDFYANALFFDDGTYGILSDALNNSVSGMLIDNSEFSSMTSADIAFIDPTIITMLLRNTKLLSTIPIFGQANMLGGSTIRASRHQQIDGNYSEWRPQGIETPDSVIYDGLAPSIRVKPSGYATCNPFYVAVGNGHSPTVSVRVRKSVLADPSGQAYSGPQPRLIMVHDPGVGVTTTTILATMTVGNGTWETLIAAIPAAVGNCVYQFLVDCDGTTGWINIDNFTTTESGSDTGAMNFAFNGRSFVALGSGTNTVVHVPIPMIRKKVI